MGILELVIVVTLTDVKKQPKKRIPCLLSSVEITDGSIRGNSTLGYKPVLNKTNLRKQIR